MNSIAAILILAAIAGAPTETRHREAVEVFHCNFDQGWDEDYDQWPEGWSRRKGTGYPHYLPIKIVEAQAGGDRALRIGLNGGAAVVVSPKIQIEHLFTYVLEALVSTEKLVNDQAYLAVTFLDENGTALETCAGPKVGGSQSSRKISMGPLAPSSQRARYAVIELHLEPADTPADLRGSASFADVWFGRLPRMRLETTAPLNIYFDRGQVEVRCELSGLFQNDPMVRFELVDGSSEIEQRNQQSRTIISEAAPATKVFGARLIDEKGFVGRAIWRPKVVEPGYYIARVTLEGHKGSILQRETTLVVMDPQPATSSGEFGWSLPQGEHPASLPVLATLLPQLGINWVKFPVWVSEKDLGRLDRVVTFAERMSRQHIDSVGLLCDPPAEVGPQLGGLSKPTAADIFSTEAEVWYPLVEPAITRLSLQVRWWQLGRDQDCSFMGYPKLPTKLSGIKKELQQFGQEIHLGIGWRLGSEAPRASAPPWEFLSLSSDPPLTADELSSYLPAYPSTAARRWLVLTPLSSGLYRAEVRAKDLVERMIAAKMQRAEAVFIPDPFDAATGLMHEDGTPGELLLPWRTTATVLRGATYIGMLYLPGGSENRIFSRDGELVMAIWNKRRGTEHLELGENARSLDAWGRSRTLTDGTSVQPLDVGPMPTFVVGISQPLVTWNMACRFENTTLPSVFGVPHSNAIVVKNTFNQGVSGRMRLVAPSDWKVYPNSFEFKLAPGEEQHQPLSITLPFDAVTGRQPVKFEFEVSGERRYQFTVDRWVDIGQDDIMLEVATRLNERGELEVEQRVVNQSAREVSFKCFLYAPERRRMVSQVVRLGQGTDTKIYRLPRGEDLVGKTLLVRAEELGGSRTLNQRFLVQP